MAPSGWDAALVTEVSDSYVLAALGHAAVPQLCNGLSVGERPFERAAVPVLLIVTAAPNPS